MSAKFPRGGGVGGGGSRTFFSSKSITYIILSDFQQYRTLLAKVTQFFVSPEKFINQRYKFLIPYL